MHRINIENEPNSFKSRLPTSLTLLGQWKCAVASATFRNDLEIDAYMDLTFTIEWHEFDDSTQFEITRNELGDNNFFSAY